MRQTTRLLLLSLLLGASGAVPGQAGPSEANGKVVYDKWCIHCHGQMERGPLPGTNALALKYRGELPALLEERTDLAPEFITTVVRGGLFGMPITRKTEVSDAELDDIIAYLTRTQAR